MAAAVGSLAGERGRWLHVCRDDGRMARFAAALGFFYPQARGADLSGLGLPAL